jgi:ankyrin repeat protein
MSALQSACEAGKEKIVDRLLERGADVQHVDKYGGNCLEEAAFYGYRSIVEKLRTQGLTSEWPLHVACGLGDIEQVKKQLAGGAEASQPNGGWQNTPMHFAAGGGHVDVAKLLLEHGATLDVKNVLGAGPLHVSAGADTLGFAKWLVAQGVDINGRDAEGNTPLDWAGEHVHEFLDAHGGQHSEIDLDE